VVQETVQCTDAALIVMPDDALDPDLITHSTVPCQPLTNCGYFNEGGVENIQRSVCVNQFRALVSILATRMGRQKLCSIALIT